MSRELFEQGEDIGSKDMLVSSLGSLLSVDEGVGDWMKTFDKISLKVCMIQKN